MEITAIMVLWNALNIRKRSLIKSFSIVLVTSVIVRITDGINAPWDSVLNFMVIIIMVKVLFNKKIKAAILEFCIVILIVILIEILLLVPYNMIKLILGNFQEGFIMNLCLLII